MQTHLPLVVLSHRRSPTLRPPHLGQLLQARWSFSTQVDRGHSTTPPTSPMCHRSTLCRYMSQTAFIRAAVFINKHISAVVQNVFGMNKYKRGANSFHIIMLLFRYKVLDSNCTSNVLIWGCSNHFRYLLLLILVIIFRQIFQPICLPEWRIQISFIAEQFQTLEYQQKYYRLWVWTLEFFWRFAYQRKETITLGSEFLPTFVLVLMFWSLLFFSPLQCISTPCLQSARGNTLGPKVNAMLFPSTVVWLM